MRAFDLSIEHHAGARTHHALDAEPAAVTTGAAGIRYQRVALDHQGEFRLRLLVRRIVGVAIVHRDCAADAVFAFLRAPAAAERAEIGDEEFARARIDPMQRRQHQVGMMAGDGAVRDRLRQRLEDGVDDGHRVGHPVAHRRRARRAHDAAGRHDHFEAAERAVVDRIVARRGQAFVGDL